MPNTKNFNLYRAHSDMLNLAPTSTGFTSGIVEIYPKLKGILKELATQVLLLNASITDFVFEVKNEEVVTVEDVNVASKRVSEEGPLTALLGYETKLLVSTDYTNDTLSLLLIHHQHKGDESMVKTYVWYVNELRYSKRMAAVCNIVATKYIAGVESSLEYMICGFFCV